MNEKILDKLWEHAKKNDLSDAECARQVGIAPQHLNAIKHKRCGLGQATADKICAYLNVTVEELIDSELEAEAIVDLEKINELKRKIDWLEKHIERQDKLIGRIAGEPEDSVSKKG